MRKQPTINQFEAFKQQKIKEHEQKVHALAGEFIVVKDKLLAAKRELIQWQQLGMDDYIRLN